MITELYVVESATGCPSGGGMPFTVYVNKTTNMVRVCARGGKWITSFLSLGDWLYNEKYTKVIVANFKEK